MRYPLWDEDLPELTKMACLVGSRTGNPTIILSSHSFHGLNKTWMVNIDQTSSTYLTWVDIAVRESHGHVVVIHNFPCDSTNNCGMLMLAERDFSRKNTKSKTLMTWTCLAVTNRTVDIFGLVTETDRQFQGGKTSIKGKVEKRFRRKGIEGLYRISETLNMCSPPVCVVETAVCANSCRVIKSNQGCSTEKLSLVSSFP
jgi:hypothetical protein